MLFSELYNNFTTHVNPCVVRPMANVKWFECIIYMNTIPLEDLCLFGYYSSRIISHYCTANLRWICTLSTITLNRLPESLHCRQYVLVYTKLMHDQSASKYKLDRYIDNLFPLYCESVKCLFTESCIYIPYMKTLNSFMVQWRIFWSKY